MTMIRPGHGSEGPAPLGAMIMPSIEAQPCHQRSLIKKVRAGLVELGVGARLIADNVGIAALPYEVGEATEPEIFELRRWIADRYVAEGFADARDRQADGTFPDSYADHSTFYRVLDRRTGQMKIGARVIRPVGDDPDTLQIKLNTLESPERQERVRELGGKVFEFATFVKEPGIGNLESQLAQLVLIRHMVQESLNEGATHHIFGLNPYIAPKFVRTFGNALESLGSSVRLGEFKIDTWKPFLLDLKRGAVDDVGHSTRGSLASLVLRSFFGTIRVPSDMNNTVETRN